MPIDFIPQPLRLFRREDDIIGSEEDCGGVRCACDDVMLGSVVHSAGDGPFHSDTTRGCDGGRSVGGRQRREPRDILGKAMTKRSVW